jgi:hypothetical protein
LRTGGCPGRLDRSRRSTLWKAETVEVTQEEERRKCTSTTTTLLPIEEGVPKLKDFPEELGGSGETVAE